MRVIAPVEDVAEALEGVREGHSYRCWCPSHGGHCLSVSEGRNGRTLVYCHYGCDFREVYAALDTMGLVGVCDDIEEYERHEDPQERKRRIDVACISWRLAQPDPRIGVYLRSRGITIPVPPVLRFLPRAPHRNGWYFPAMVALVVDVEGAALGIHKTYLAADGTGKYPFPDKSMQRECCGPIKGGVVRLAPLHPSEPLAIAEGIETALSFMQLHDFPTWAALSTSGLMALELPLEVRNVIIAADNDRNGAGRDAALAAYYRWRDEGRTVQIWMPRELGTDFNDRLMGR
jgi:hypothetical protein